MKQQLFWSSGSQRYGRALKRSRKGHVERWADGSEAADTGKRCGWCGRDHAERQATAEKLGFDVASGPMFTMACCVSLLSAWSSPHWLAVIVFGALLLHLQQPKVDFLAVRSSLLPCCLQRARLLFRVFSG